MRNPEPCAVKGKHAEDRCIRLLRSLKGETFVRSVFKTSMWLDERGVDALVHLAVPHSQKCIVVPVQVKSSLDGVIQYCEKHPECVLAGVLTIIVNERLSDDFLKSVLVYRLSKMQHAPVDFSVFLHTLRCIRPAHTPRVHVSSQMKFDYIYHVAHPRVR
jgi:hypothetical protein